MVTGNRGDHQQQPEVEVRSPARQRRRIERKKEKKKEKEEKSLLAPQDFELEATVGKGGFGQVFLVHPRESAIEKVNLK